jgi:hypothetical protein
VESCQSRNHIYEEKEKKKREMSEKWEMAGNNERDIPPISPFDSGKELDSLQEAIHPHPLIPPLPNDGRGGDGKMECVTILTTSLVLRASFGVAQRRQSLFFGNVCETVGWRV